MFNNIFNKAISIFLILFFIAGLFPPYIFSQPNPSPSLGEVKGFNKSVFESYFSKADRELSPDRWLYEAKLGLTQAMGAWELIAGNLYDNTFLFQEAKDQLEKWSNEELEKRFSKWLMGRFFGEISEKALTDLMLLFNETQKNYSWHLDNEGKIIFDNITGDPLVIRPNDENKNYSEDLAVWRGEASDHLKLSNISIENAFFNLFPELLVYIPVDKRESMKTLLLENVSAKTNSIKREFENIAEREERIFASKRTRDIWSLRKKNDNEAARIFTQKLIAQTEESCKTGIEELNTKIEQAAAGTGDLALLGEQWLQLYKEQFDRGLKAWEQAEERFFIRRIEWEQESQRLFSEGEQMWLAAFNQFTEERQKWEINARELFLNGEMMFKNLSEEFERNIAEAKREFELNMAMRIGEGTTRVKALVDMYLVCSSAAFSTMDNIQYWFNQYSGIGKVDPKNANFSDWLQRELSNYDTSLPRNKPLLEMEKCYEMYLSYMDKALDARERILKDYAEILGTDVLKDILSPNASSEDFCLDEYQIALIRAKVLVLYWERKTKIAEAVMEYANEFSAGRKTEAEGLRAWEEAKTAFNHSLAVYENELKKLNDAGENIKNQQVVLFNLNQQMQREEEKLNRLSSEYSILVSLAAFDHSDYYLTDFNEKYNNLAEIYKLLQKTGDEAYYKTLLECAVIWGILEQKEIAENILYTLENNKDLSSQERESLYNYYLSLTFYQDEIWQNTCESLELLFYDYGIILTENILPDINTICENIFLIPGDFVKNTVQFLIKFDNCFNIIPHWLEIEIGNWKSAFLEYISIYAFSLGFKPEKDIAALNVERDNFITEYLDLYNENENDETINDALIEIINNLFIIDCMTVITEAWDVVNYFANSGNEQHWRQYLKDEYIKKTDPSLILTSTWQEGVLTDALYNAIYFTNRLNDSFTIFSQRNLFDINESVMVFSYLYSQISLEISGIFGVMESLGSEIADTVKAFEYSRMTPEETINKLLAVETELKTQEEIYNSFVNNYFREVDKFINIGNQYDRQYSYLKTVQDNSDQKRFEYEKQDAIQRWASTAYLDTDIIKLDNCKENLLKARTVLDVLSDLYEGERKRPFENPEYDFLYSSYEKSFRIKMKTLDAIETLSFAINQEKANNAKLLSNYLNAVNTLGYVEQDYSNYVSSVSRSTWTIKDMIMVKDGRLAFSMDSSMRLIGVNDERAYELDEFFNKTQMSKLTSYDESLIGLSQRMSGYLSNDSKYRRWSHARDYLITSLINANGDISLLKSFYSGQGQMAPGGNLANQLVMTGVFDKKISLYSAIGRDYIFTSADDIARNAWNSLSAAERADLEYYVILTLSGRGNGYLTGFSQFYTYDVYRYGCDYVYEKYLEAKKVTDNPFIFFVSWLWFDMKDTNYYTLQRITGVLTETYNNANSWISGLKSNLLSIKKLSLAYIESCNKLEILEGKKREGENIGWTEIKQALLKTGRIKEKEIGELETYWEIKQNEIANLEFNNVSQALTALLNLAANDERKNKNDLENFWLFEKDNQQKNEIEYLAAADAYIKGNIDIETLKTAADKAYGIQAAAWKNHYNNMFSVYSDNLSLYLSLNFNYYSEFSTVADEITLLTAKTLENRYNAELTAREMEWSLTLKDLSEKYDEWQITAALILENGRTDWNTSFYKMEQAYKQWTANFQNEYERVSDEWALVYLAGLEDKEKWLSLAADAVNNASMESFISLIGTEGERLSRFIDTREPLGIKGAIPQTRLLMEELLQSSGIANMYRAFGSLNGITNTVSTLVKRGLGGVSAWDSRLAKITAHEFARKTNERIADNEAKILANNTRLAAEEVIKSLTNNVNQANDSFRKNMDDIFIFNGLWRRSGNNYAKDIIKGSALFVPVIAETITITGFINYKADLTSLKTNLDENYLAGLNSIAIRGLLENVVNEVQFIAEDIFGFGKSPIIINKNGEQREQSPGKFGAHIGYKPADKLSYYSGTDRKKMFYDGGEGELGRLLSDFIYWSVIDNAGIAEMTLAPWDKRIWNDEGSWFKAPSLKSVGTIACSIVAGAVTGGMGLAGIAAFAGISSASEIAFSSLDVAFGYKTFDEAAFSIGKSLVINGVSSLSGGLFNGIAKDGVLIYGGLTKNVLDVSSNSIYQIAAGTAMAGVQTLTTTLATAAVSGINYSNENGFSYNTSVFDGVFNSSLTTMASTFVSTGMQAINSGLDSDEKFGFSKLFGFNKLNQSDLQKLNGLAGSLAGQGINYALGGNFTLNVLNLSQINGMPNSGLLELNFGRDGATMNIGTGGVDVSFNNLQAVLRGAKVWNVNNRISDYGDEKDFDALVSLRAQYGYGDDTQKNQLWDILNGDVILNTGIDGDFFAQTILNENGQKMINLASYSSNMSVEDQFLLATKLGHEAYRDGIVTEDNYLETRIAVQAHTDMALRMRLAGINISDENLLIDILKLNEARANNDMSSFYSYVDENYDSSGDYWKLVMQNGIAGFEWDGELSYDLSMLGIDDRVNSLDDDTLRAIWNLGSDKSFNDFKIAASTFDTLNGNLLRFETALAVAPSRTITKSSFDNYWISFINALESVGNSGLLAKTAAVILDLEGSQIFANGKGEITCDYGWRAVDWNSNVKNKFQQHFAWDLGARGNEANKNMLVAPMDGTLAFNFTQGYGLRLVTSGGNNESITYSHADGKSLRNFIELYSSNGITLNNNGALTGISQNMIIGMMGNTGTLSANPHVDLIYTVNGIVQNPAMFFYENGNRAAYSMTPYANLMSGLSTAADYSNFNLTVPQINGIFDYYSIHRNSSTSLTNAMRFAGNSNNLDDFIKIMLERSMR
ncbi:MAG: hypothetical protein FWD24_01025 [Treponema sp.]|nr:hypothetical protein [Treponema sp.]